MHTELFGLKDSTLLGLPTWTDGSRTTQETFIGVPLSTNTKAMEHLPCPASAVGKEKTSVPYVCLENYDGGPFMTYPSRVAGLPDLQIVGLFPGQFSRPHQLQIASLPKRELESFYQTWLFFGLLNELLGSLYVPEDFINTCEDHSGHTKALSTGKLNTAIEEWVARIQAGKADPPVTYAHVARCLCMAHAAISIQAIHSSIDPDVRLCLVSLGQNLAYATNNAFNVENPGQDVKYPSSWKSLIDEEYWERRFLAHGWCPTETKLIIDTTLSVQTLHFLACLDKTDAGKDHRSCTTQQCRAYQNDLGAYQTKHISNECNCKDLAIDPETLHHVLKSKALPLIRVRQGQTLSEISIDIVASRPTSRYVALSHVWADGLGNPYANALPRCQLSDIGKMIKKLDIAARSRDIQDHCAKEEDVHLEEPEEEELLLWCDTLCCPVHTEEAKHLALEYMYQTYHDASHVLVLDASFGRLDSGVWDMDEVSMRIFNSPWMRRLWTLQEGALAAVTNRLWFQLARRAVNLRELRINARDRYFSSIDRRGLGGDMLRRLGSFANIFLDNNSTHPRADLGKVVEALHHRSVSVASDEALLIGNLLGLDAAQILSGGDGTAGRRMNRLWRLLPSAVHGIMSDLLFRVGPRLAEPGLRWAPATLLIDNDVNKFILSSGEEEDQASLTPSDGLFVRLHGFRLLLPLAIKGLPSPRESIGKLNSREYLWAKDDAGSWYQFARSLPVEQDEFLTDKTLAEVILKGDNLWVLHPNPEFPRPLTSTGQSTTGLIVEVIREEEAGKEGTPVKIARAKLHINLAPWRTHASAEFALGTTLSAQLIADSPTLVILATMEDSLDVPSWIMPSLKKTALEELRKEIRQMAISAEAKNPTATDGRRLDFGLVESVIKMVVWGEYLCMGEKATKSQGWCVD